MTRFTIRLMIIFSVAGGLFPPAARAEGPKGGAQPTEQTGVTTPIRVILPALWDQKTQSSKPEATPVNERQR